MTTEVSFFKLDEHRGGCCPLDRGEEGNSSNRAELGAACLALEDVKRQQDRKPVILLSDSACFPPEDPVRMLLGVEIVPDHPQIGVSTAALTYQYDDESDTDTDDDVLRNQVQFEIPFYARKPGRRHHARHHTTLTRKNRTRSSYNLQQDQGSP